ncbi:MAG: NAD-dependent malic enzyme, partial [Actinomycetota bacterium]|nr:NAD-dependent malic enzyme [Actinomycetota bacterium]
MLDITFRVQTRHRPGMLAQIAGAIGDREGLIGHVTTEKLAREATVREITVEVRDDDHATAIAETLNGLDGVEVLWQRDRA